MNSVPSPPDLPNTPFRFACRYILLFRWWYFATFWLETGAAAVSISIPYALGRITRTVVSSGAHPKAMLALRLPFALFVALSVADLVFSRAAGNCQFTVSSLCT